MSEDPLEVLILQTINGALATIPGYMEEIKQDKDTLKVENGQEWLYGLVMGMALGMSGAYLTIGQDKPPTKEDQIRVRNMVYKHIPDIRERIFNQQNSK